MMRTYSVFGLGEKRRSNRKKRPSLFAHHRVGAAATPVHPQSQAGARAAYSNKKLKGESSAASRLSWAQGERCSGAI